MSRVAVIAALPMELKPLVRGWTHAASNGVDLWTRSQGGRTWIAACGGCGASAARRAFQEVLKLGPLDAVASVGLAGALTPRLSPGTVHPIALVVDAETGQRFQVSGGQPGQSLVSAPAVAGKADKERLAAAFGAGLVDMEAAEVAALALDAGIAFHCVKGISDGFGDPLPPMDHYLTPEGRVRMAGVVGYVLLRPWIWWAMIRLSGNTARAVKGLHGPLVGLLGWPT